MTSDSFPPFVTAKEAPLRKRGSVYPAPFSKRVAGRSKHPLGALFGLVNFGVNLTRLAPGAATALRHAHTVQDEFVYVLAGRPTLITSDGRFVLEPGQCAGFKAGTGNGHHLVNESEEEVSLLEVGDRTKGDGASYPDDDLHFSGMDGTGHYVFTHKDGTPYGS